MHENVYDVVVKRIEGSTTPLSAYRGKVLLIVNVASKCGLTPQYTGLEKLYRDKHSRGLEILGFPANDFAGQEPGTEAEIASFCSTQYDVTFPMFAKITVKNGPNQHPLYGALIHAQPHAANVEGFREKLKGYGIEPGDPTEVTWNFEKFLVDRQGAVVARFSPDTTADDPTLTAAIDRELAR